jgi:hypothetical protein
MHQRNETPHAIARGPAGDACVVIGFSDIVTVSITTPCRAHDLGFSLQQGDGVRIVTFTSGSGPRPASRTDPPATLAANARGSFAPAGEESALQAST